MAVTVIWHYLGLAAILGLGSVYVGFSIIRWFRTRAQKAPVAQEPVSTSLTTRREFIGTCAALAPSVFTFSLAGVALQQLNHFRIRRMTVSIPTLPRALDGLTIAHVTDVHIGEWTHGPILQQMVEATNAMQADIVALTGDLINYEISDLPEAISLVKQLQSRYGLWMVEGNHDLYENAVEFEHKVKAAGLRLLLDESDMAEIRGCPVQFFGIRWMEGIGAHRDRVTALQMDALMKQRQPDAFPIFLAHHPHSFDAAVKANLPLTLTGHTHGGQLMFDNQLGVGPMLFRYWSGLYQHGNSQLIVSNGVGNMFPIRINAPAEILHITLRSGEA
jgi:predicted MPP superfamily phosphohydrolase